MKNQLTIVVPAYNEAETLSTYVYELDSFCVENKIELIIVNDGSSDNTKDILEKASSDLRSTFKLINHKINKGYGAALKTGLSNVNTQFAVTMDSDGQHRFEDVLKLKEQQNLTDSDMVIGSREINSSGLYRAIGKKIIKKFVKMVARADLKDLNSGLKYYKTDLVKRYLKLCPDSMAFSEIITLTFLTQKHLVTEIDIQVNDRVNGVSTINTKTAFEAILEVINLVMLFEPARIFFPVSFFFFLMGMAWGLPIIISGQGVSVGASLLLLFSVMVFLVGLLATQLSYIRRDIALNN